MKNWEDEIAYQKGLLAPVKAEADRIKAVIRDLEDRAVGERFGAVVGARVIKDRNGQEFEITSIDHCCFETTKRPWVHGKKVKVDGTLAKRSQLLFTDWKPK